MEIKERILKLLEEVYPQDLPIKEIAERLGFSRNTVAKYVAVLEAENKIEHRYIGKAGLCRAKKG